MLVTTEVAGAVDGRTQEQNVGKVVRAAEQELRRLLQQRAEVTQRIGAIKRTLAGLADLLGYSILDDDLGDLLGSRAANRNSGFTRACRLVLVNSSVPLNAHQVCEQVQQKFPQLIAHHRAPLSSVSTVLRRLADYGEARSLHPQKGPRLWEWIADTGPDSGASFSQVAERQASQM